MRNGIQFKKRVQGPERQARAPFPHPWTFVFGFLSPLLALVALGLSIYSLYRNSESTRRAQQAYIGISNARAGSVTSRANRIPGSLDVLYQNSVQFSVDNLGNTSAVLFGTTLRVSNSAINLPAGAALVVDDDRPVPVGELRPHSSKPGSYIVKLVQDGKEIALPEAVGDELVKQGVEIRGEVDFKTLFSDDMLHNSWCWRTTSSNIPLDCVVDPDKVHKSLTR